MRSPQGDASPLRSFALRLGIGRRDVPFLGAISLLAHTAPCDVEEGDAPDWLTSRHAHTATRRLSYTLGLDEHAAWALVQAGRGRARGLDAVRSILLSVLTHIEPEMVAKYSDLAVSYCDGNDTAAALMSHDGVFVLLTYIVESFGAGACGPNAQYFVTALDDTTDSLLIAFFEKQSLQTTISDPPSDSRGVVGNGIGGADSPRLSAATDPVARAFLQGLSQIGSEPLPLDCAFFLLALPTRRSARAIGSIVSRYLDRQATTNELSARDFSQCARVVLALAHGDERAMKRAAYDATILKKIGFRVRADTSAAAVPDQTSLIDSIDPGLLPYADEISDPCGAPTYGGIITEDHPLIFLLRFAWRRESCFDVLPPGARVRGLTVTIAEKRLCADLPALKVRAYPTHDFAAPDNRRLASAPGCWFR